MLTCGLALIGEAGGPEGKAFAAVGLGLFNGIKGLASPGKETAAWRQYQLERPLFKATDYLVRWLAPMRGLACFDRLPLPVGSVSPLPCLPPLDWRSPCRPAKSTLAQNAINEAATQRMQAADLQGFNEVGLGAPRRAAARGGPDCCQLAAATS